MVIRAGLTVLWFGAGWMCWAMIAFVLGLPGAFTPIAALTVAGFVAWWSGGREWHIRRTPRAVLNAVSSSRSV